MKKIIFTLLCCLPVFFLSAQKADRAVAQRAIDKTAQLKTILSLDAKQEAAVLKIQDRKDRQMAEIESLKNSNYELYTKKVDSIHKGNEIAVQRLLNKEQLAAYHQHRSHIRMEKARLTKKMKAEGASKKAIEKAVKNLEYEFDS